MWSLRSGMAEAHHTKQVLCELAAQRPRTSLRTSHVAAACQRQGRTVSASRRILLAASMGGRGLARPAGSPTATPTLHPRCIAVLKRLRIEPRANGEASSVMASAGMCSRLLRLAPWTTGNAVMCYVLRLAVTGWWGASG